MRFRRRFWSCKAKRPASGQGHRHRGLLPDAVVGLREQMSGLLIVNTPSLEFGGGVANAAFSGFRGDLRRVWIRATHSSKLPGTLVAAWGWFRAKHRLESRPKPRCRKARSWTLGRVGCKSATATPAHHTPTPASARSGLQQVAPDAPKGPIGLGEIQSAQPRVDPPA